MAQISIIIPAYNAASYLNRCIDSLLAQTFKCWNIILIDDGSTDATLHICRAYESRDHRIRVIHKENSGVSITRQVGLDKVDTPFFIFCDADDYVEPDYLEELYNSIITNHSDIAVCQYWEEHEYTSVVMNLPETNIAGFIHNFLKDKVWGVTWNKLYRKKIVCDNNIQFVPHLQMWEDLAFTIDYCIYSNSISFVQKPLYHYVKTNSGSITKFENLNKKMDRVQAIKHFERTIFTKNREAEFHNSLLTVKYHISRDFIGRISKEHLKLFETCFPEIFNDKFIFKKHFIICLLVKWHLTDLLYLEYFYKYIKRKTKHIIKSILHKLFKDTRK